MASAVPLPFPANFSITKNSPMWWSAPEISFLTRESFFQFSPHAEAMAPDADLIQIRKSIVKSP